MFTLPLTILNSHTQWVQSDIQVWYRMKGCWEMAFMKHSTMLCLWVTRAFLPCLSILDSCCFQALSRFRLLPFDLWLLVPHRFRSPVTSQTLTPTQWFLFIPQLSAFPFRSGPVDCRWGHRSLSGEASYGVRTSVMGKQVFFGMKLSTYLVHKRTCPLLTNSECFLFLHTCISGLSFPTFVCVYHHYYYYK